MVTFYKNYKSHFTKFKSSPKFPTIWYTCTKLIIIIIVQVQHAIKVSTRLWPHNVHVPDIQTCTCGSIAAMRRYIVIIACSVQVHCTWDYTWLLHHASVTIVYTQHGSSVHWSPWDLSRALIIFLWSYHILQDHSDDTYHTWLPHLVLVVNYGTLGDQHTSHFTPTILACYHQSNRAMFLNVREVHPIWYQWETILPHTITSTAAISMYTAWIQYAPVGTQLPFMYC